jgi:hypothetical protein
MEAIDALEQPRHAARPEAMPPVSLCGSLLGEHRHVCAFFNGPDEEYRVTLPLIRDGFGGVDKARSSWTSAR